MGKLLLTLLGFLIAAIDHSAAEVDIGSHHGGRRFQAVDKIGSHHKCLTYHERYHEVATPIAPSPRGAKSSRFAVLVRYYTRLPEAKDDQVRNLRALVAECARSGLHVYFLYQVREDDQPLSLESIKRKLPPDLRQFLVPWQKEVTQRYYASMSPDAWVDSPHLRGIDWGTGPAAAYLPLVLFMHANQAYDFAWVLEDDNRFIGDWGLFLSTALAVASSSGNVAQLTEAIEGGFEGVSGQGHPATEDLPDFVSFTDINRDSDKWAATASLLDPPYAESFLMMWGASRKLFNAMHQRSLEGAFAYYETFMPTVALAENLTLVALPLPNTTFQCCSQAAEHLHSDWYRSRLCHRLGLLHPVKLLGEWW